MIPNGGKIIVVLWIAWKKNIDRGVRLHIQASDAKLGGQMQTMDVEYSIFIGHGTRITSVNVTIHWVIVVFRAVYIYIGCGAGCMDFTLLLYVLAKITSGFNTISFMF